MLTLILHSHLFLFHFIFHLPGKPVKCALSAMKRRMSDKLSSLLSALVLSLSFVSTAVNIKHQRKEKALLLRGRGAREVGWDLCVVVAVGFVAIALKCSRYFLCVAFFCLFVCFCFNIIQAAQAFQIVCVFFSALLVFMYRFIGTRSLKR